jgi:hypothetical protein
MQTLVDERFELAALIFRLAGAPPYTDLKSDYQKEIAETFARFAGHRAVRYARKIKKGYDQVFRFAVHVEKNNGRFVFLEDIKSLTDCGWKTRNARKFLKLLNQFYVDTGYAAFFNAHAGLFERATREFVDEDYGKIDLAWFGKYVDPSNLRCVLSLSSGNYGVTVNGKVIYSLAHVDSHGVCVHEYCHSFANPLADKWYQENEEFKAWCDGSVNRRDMPFYGHGTIMAREYVTRAYAILYSAQHGRDTGGQISKEKEIGFKSIEQVYEMILALEQ